MSSIRNFIIAAVVLTAGASWLNYQDMSDDLLTRAKTVALSEGVKWANISNSGRDLKLEGSAPLGAWLDKAEQDIRNLDGVRTLTSEAKKKDPVKPYLFNFRKDEKGTKASGYAPSVVGQKSLLRILGGDKNDIDLADGAPDNWASAVEQGHKLAGLLESGEVILQDKILSVTGKAKDRKFSENLENALNASGLKLGNFEVELPRPEPLRIRRMQGEIDLSGAVPDSDLKHSLITAAKEGFLGEKVTDDLVIDPDHPSGWQNVAMKLVAQLGNMREGEIVLDQKNIRFTGQSYVEGAAQGIQQRLAELLPSDYNLNNIAETVTYSKAENLEKGNCQVALRELVEKRSIQFESGSSKLTASSSVVLNPVAFTLSRCPSARIEVAGHTDSDGDPEANMALSRERSTAVIEYLTKLGIDRNRLIAVGYGATRPAVSGVSEEAKLKNRRIEFILLP